MTKSYIVMMASVCIMMLTGLSSATRTGIAMSANERVLKDSKRVVMDFLSTTIQEIHFDDIQVLNLWSTYNVKFRSIEIREEDCDISISGNDIIIDVREAGGSFSGNARKPKLFGGFDEFSFDFHVDKGGFRHMRFEFGLDKQFVDGRTLPSIKVHKGYFDFNRHKFRLDINTDDWLLKTGSFLINTFKDAYLAILQPMLNLSFPLMANLAVSVVETTTRGEVNGGLIGSLVSILPQNQIRVPQDIYISYEMADDNRARIDNGKVIGYFVGDVKGLHEDQQIRGDEYLQLGDLNLDNNDAPFQYQISTKVLNLMFEVILGKNQIPIDLSYDIITASQFPIAFTSTQLEGAIPDLCDFIGYDVPLSGRFKNVGAPRFVFNNEAMTIKYSMEVEVWDEAFTKQYLTLTYHDIVIDFDMKLKDMHLRTEWHKIQMSHAEVRSDIVTTLAKTRANAKVTNYFNWAFDLIVPWVNELHPTNVSDIPIPTEIDGLVRINDLHMDVRDNYFSFTLDPEFLIKSRV